MSWLYLDKITGVDPTTKHHYQCNECTALSCSKEHLKWHAERFAHTQNSNAQLARGERTDRKVPTLADEMKSSASLSNDYMGTVLEQTITNQNIQLEQAQNFPTFCLICNLSTTTSREKHVTDVLHQPNLKLLAGGNPLVDEMFHCTVCGLSVHKSSLDLHFDDLLHHQNTELRNASIIFLLNLLTVKQRRPSTWVAVLYM